MTRRLGVSALALMLASGAIAACDRGVAGEAEATTQSALSEDTEPTANRGPGAIEAFDPSVPAAWDERDPEVDLQGRDALMAYLNDLRAQNGLDPMSWDERLEEAAASHAKYIMDNKAAIDASGVSVHAQDPALPGFTGETYVTRGEHFGYEGKCFAEVVAFKPTAVGAARQAAESLYHRFPLLEASAVHIGYAELQLGAIKVNVIEVGSHEL